MHQSSILPSTHTDLITDAAYDYFGTRLATASADQKIKVWRRGADGSWEVEESWKAHDSPIAKIAWSHPEHGPLLASCSYDRTVRIWEENNDEPRNSGKRWHSIAKLVESKGSVRDLAFAPSEFGLRLATISSDSHLRLYAPSLPSLHDWYPLSSPHIPSLIAGDDKPSQPNPAEGGISRMLGRTGAGGPAESTSGPVVSGGNEVGGGGRCLSWCKEKWWGMVVAVGEGADGDVQIISLPQPSPPVHLLTLTLNATALPSTPSSAFPPQPSAPVGPIGSKLITTVSWAPSCGREFHLIATGSRDGFVRIWKITTGEGAGSDGRWAGEVVAEMGDHGRTITRVEWNVTGTVLTSSGDDGKVRLWKATYADNYACLAVFDAQADQDAME